MTRGRRAAAAEDRRHGARGPRRARRQRARCCGCWPRSTSRSGVDRRRAARHDAARSLRRGRDARAGTSCAPSISPRASSCCARCSARVKVVEHVTALAAEGRGPARRRVRYEIDANVARDRRPTCCCCIRAWCPDINLTDADRLRASLERPAGVLGPIVDDWGGTHGARTCSSPATVRASPAPRRRRRAGSSPRWPSPTRSAASTPRRATRGRGRTAPGPRASAMRGRRFFDTLYRPGRRVPHAARATPSSAAARRSPRTRSSTAVAAGLRRTQPAEGLPALRDGAVPGPLLRAHRHRADRPRAQASRRRRSATTGCAFR